MNAHLTLPRPCAVVPDMLLLQTLMCMGVLGLRPQNPPLQFLLYTTTVQLDHQEHKSSTRMQQHIRHICVRTHQHITIATIAASQGVCRKAILSLYQTQAPRSHTRTYTHSHALHLHTGACTLGCMGRQAQHAQSSKGGQTCPKPAAIHRSIVCSIDNTDVYTLR